MGVEAAADPGDQRRRIVAQFARKLQDYISSKREAHQVDRKREARCVRNTRKSLVKPAW